MKKKLTSLFLALLLVLSLISTALAAPLPTDPEPEITPIVTLQPGEPEEPGIDPQFDGDLPNFPPPPPILEPLD